MLQRREILVFIKSHIYHQRVILETFTESHLGFYKWISLLHTKRVTYIDSDYGSKKKKEEEVRSVFIYARFHTNISEGKSGMHIPPSLIYVQFSVKHKVKLSEGTRSSKHRPDST